MNTVDPIREIEDIQKMKSVLLNSNYRDYLIFLLGINTGLRISDIINLKVSDIRNKYHITIREKKTGKEKKFLLNESLKSELEKFTAAKQDGDYIFNSKRNKNKPLDRQRIYFILNAAAREAGLNILVGTHTLRKTFGFHFYQRTKDIALLQQLFNHSGQSVTLKYIGINQSISDDAMRNFNL